VINRVNAEMMDRSSCGPVIEDVKRIARSFVLCSFKHVYRVVNVVAHNLARRCEFSVDVVWCGSPPVSCGVVLLRSVSVRIFVMTLWLFDQ
jgi:hypothetical protein